MESSKVFDAPPLITPNNDSLNDTNNNNINNNNNIQLINSHESEFKYEDKKYKVILSITSNKKFLVIQALLQDDLINIYENKMSFEDLIKFDVIFRMCKDIEESLEYMIELIKNPNNSIKEIVDNKFIISINIINLNSTYRQKNLELFKKHKNKDEIIDILIQEINNLKIKNIKLEGDIKIITNENNNIKESFNKYKNEMNQELNNLKETINTIKSNLFPIDSKIIKKNNDYNFIVERLKKVKLNENQNKEQNQNVNININCNLLYRATRDGDEAKEFHTKCDKFNNTLVLVLTKKGLRFGGFTCQTWEGKEVDKKDKNAFCFSLDKMKIYNSIKGKSAIFASPDSGPAFENCIFEIKDKCLSAGGLCSDESGSYYDNHENICEINGGEEQFEVEEVEVFNVIFK